MLNQNRWSGWKVGNLRPTFEPILWFVKPYPIGTTIADNILEHGLGGFNEKALLTFQREPENIISCGMDKGEGGLHPTQKPVRLMRTLIELTTMEGQVVIDPFCGSGTTLVAAQLSGRNYLGIEKDDHFCRVARRRLSKRTLFDVAGD
jgi:site-specific DNA-methyltransferase (adenine-specific)